MTTQVLPRDDFEGLNMTMPNERTRAVIQTGEFLLKLSQDSSLPERIRRDAKSLLRHYPNPFQMLLAGRIEEASDPNVSPMGPIFSSSAESGYHSPIIYTADTKIPR